MIYHVSVDHQHNLDHTDFKVILNFHVLSLWSNGMSLVPKFTVFVVPGSISAQNTLFFQEIFFEGIFFAFQSVMVQQ